MRSTYRVLAYVIAAGVAVQAASVALGFFLLLHILHDGGVVSADYDWATNLGVMVHRFGGLGLIPLSCLGLLIVSFFTKAPGAVRWALVIFGLMLLQIALVFAAFDVAAFAGALHGLNALALMLAAIWAARRLRPVARTEERVRDAAAV